MKQTTKNMQQRVLSAVERLGQLDGILRQHKHITGEKPPSVKSVVRTVELIREILFPGFYGVTPSESETLPYYIGVNTMKLRHMLYEQLRSANCYNCKEKSDSGPPGKRCQTRAEETAIAFIERLPLLRQKLLKDVQAMYDGDPAAENYEEVIFCYPGVRAITNYRIAHELHRLGAELLPRIISELAHSETGIDIHPLAEIGEYFAIDHGTGIVVGATTIIGNRVTLYQGVTLGARSIQTDNDGKIIRGVNRHPIVEDDVVIYAQATILGRITVGSRSIIGGNVWITQDVPADSLVLQPHQHFEFHPRKKQKA